MRHPIKGMRRLWWYMIYKPRFAAYHWADIIVDTRQMTPRYVSLGKRVRIGPHARIQGVTKYNDITYTPMVVLCDGVSIEQNIHLTCADRVEIGQNTAIGANVTITDIEHPYDNIDLPVEQHNIRVKKVNIGRDSKIYNGAVILPGTKIGNHCVVGANAVVSGVIPDYSVVVGAPSRIVKRYDKDCGKWRKTDKTGKFIIND